MPVDKNDSWWQRHKRVIWLFVIPGCIIFVICGYVFHWTWTGFNAYQDPKIDRYHTQTVWDWLQLLALPVFVSIVASLLNSADNERERRMTAQRAKTEDAIASEKREATLLQDYLDRMSTLLLAHKLREPDIDAEAQTIARAHTLVVLSQLNGKRKGRLIQFLYESELIISKRKDCPPCISLKDADLSDVDLGNLDLSGANLSGANLAGAKLNGVNLSEAQLRGISLHKKADLNEAVLRSADLRGANLSEATLNGAWLQDADLSYAKLSGASLTGTDLTGANLSDAITTRITLERTIYNQGTFSNEQLSAALVKE